uniref:Uncharacterized protein n=1 Tax=Cyanothece sp. (strain PCC 7425 / ATCC 29141) TaxID=395961 RepID=B8HMY8_CYAP4
MVEVLFAEFGDFCRSLDCGGQSHACSLVINLPLVMVGVFGTGSMTIAPLRMAVMSAMDWEITKLLAYCPCRCAGLTDNGDAQFYRALQRNGVWDEMKRNNSVSNYADGGTVGPPIVSQTFLQGRSVWQLCGGNDLHLQ